MDEVKLLPCPFCGSQPEIMEGHRNHWRVECPRCGVRRAQFANGGIEEDKARAVRSWNHRPTTLVTDEVVERVAKVIDAATGFYLPRDDVVAAARAAIAAMPAIPPQSLDDHALPPSGLSQSSLSQAKPAAAIAREGSS